MAEVIESKRKPSLAWGTRHCTSFTKGPVAPQKQPDQAMAMRALLALGEQDADPAGLNAPGISIEGASSDHLVVSGAAAALAVGDEQRFQVSYSSLLRAMTSPFVSRCFIGGPA